MIVFFVGGDLGFVRALYVFFRSVLCSKEGILYYVNVRIPAASSNIYPKILCNVIEAYQVIWTLKTDGLELATPLTTHEDCWTSR